MFWRKRKAGNRNQLSIFEKLIRIFTASRLQGPGIIVRYNISLSPVQEQIIERDADCLFKMYLHGNLHTEKLSCVENNWRLVSGES